MQLFMLIFITHAMTIIFFSLFVLNKKKFVFVDTRVGIFFLCCIFWEYYFGLIYIFWFSCCFWFMHEADYQLNALCVRVCAPHRMQCNGHTVSKCMKMWANLWYFLFWKYFISSPYAVSNSWHNSQNTLNIYWNAKQIQLIKHTIDMTITSIKAAIMHIPVINTDYWSLCFTPIMWQRQKKIYNEYDPMNIKWQI